MLTSTLCSALLAAAPASAVSEPPARVAIWLRPLYASLLAVGTAAGIEQNFYVPVGASVRVAGGWSVDVEGSYFSGQTECWSTADGVCIHSETTTFGFGVAYGSAGLEGWFAGPRLLYSRWSTSGGRGGISGAIVVPPSAATEWILAVEGGYRWKLGHFHVAVAPGLGAGISVPNQHHEFAGPFGGHRGPNDQSPQIHYVNLDLLRLGAVF